MRFPPPHPGADCDQKTRRRPRKKIVKEMKRSGTLLSGQGIYSRQDRPVLMVALTVMEVAHLKAIVRAQDPQAFVVVISAQEVLGGSFQPLKEEK
ncbi:MAG: YitT family protein [Bacteroidales bacterium]